MQWVKITLYFHFKKPYKRKLEETSHKSAKKSRTRSPQNGIVSILFENIMFYL
jgi:hypothetical protein